MGVDGLPAGFPGGLRRWITKFAPRRKWWKSSPRAEKGREMNGMNYSGFWKKIGKAGAELLALDARTCAVCGRDIREGAVCVECARQLAEARILQVERLSGIPYHRTKLQFIHNLTRGRHTN